MGRIIPCTVGEKWNSWTVIEEVGYSKSGHLKVIAKCDCGTIREVYYSKLKYGTSKSCGKCNHIEVKKGDKYGRWNVIGDESVIRFKNKHWLCKCECGTEKFVNEYKLIHGLSISCGCYSRESVSKRMKVHGISHTKIYSEWQHMRRRCLPNAECKKNYYDRDIKVCEEWQNDFEAFYDYVSKLEHYGEKEYSLDRINNDKNYEPGNVRWASCKEQSRNKTNTIHVNYKGIDWILCELLEKKNLPYQTIRRRIKNGWSIEKAIDTPIKQLTKKNT